MISLNDKVNKKKLKDFRNYKITSSLFKYAKKNVFLHCLPRGNEVDNKVFQSKIHKYGFKHSTEFMYKKVYYCFVLQIKVGNGLPELAFKYFITDALSASF